MKGTQKQQKATLHQSLTFYNTSGEVLIQIKPTF